MIKIKNNNKISNLLIFALNNYFRAMWNVNGFRRLSINVENYECSY